MPQHSLLKRQFKLFFSGMEQIPPEWKAFIEAVDHAYLEADKDRMMIERSLDLSSQELLQANSEMRAVVQAFPDIFFLLDPSGTILSYKGGPTADFLLSPDQLVGKRIQDAPLANKDGQFEQALRDAQDRKAAVSIEYALSHRGQFDFYEARLVPLQDGSILMIVRNISERKQAELALRNAHDELENRVAARTRDLLAANRALQDQVIERKRAEAERDRFFALSNDMFCVAGFDGYFKQVNPAWEATLGWTIADLLARPYIEFIHPDDRPSTQAAAQQVEAGRPLLTFENRYRRKDGSYRWFQWNATPFEEQQLIYATARDITEHRLLEDQLRQSQKIEAVGQLAGGIAHDFNNILFIIQGYAESLKAGLPDDSAEHEAANQIESATNRAASLTQQLLAFGRKQVIRPSVLSLNNIVVATSTMLTRVIGEDIVMTTSLDPMLGLTKADPGQIERVLVNLALNARDAMPQGGSLTIKTLNELVETDRHVGQEIIPAGRYVTLTMKDTGCGIDQASLSRIFEPFFTTKERGRGTGLGLSSVHGIVKQHQGYIVADSEPGKGATFTIYLPMDADAPQADKPESGTQKPFRGTETVMVVEDEPQVGLLLSTKLRRLGYTVLCATNATDALKQADAHGKPIHLLVTDVVMPGMNGRELADALRASCPDISILFMSGYPDDVIGRYGVLDRGTAFLQKPFHTNTLAEKIRELLAAKSNQP